jgi:DNA-binding transcriptional LysR family regulator
VNSCKHDAPDLAARLANVDLNLLPQLVALLQERGVTRAAHRVGISQPAMSHSLARLRTLLNDEILVRVGRGYGLTPRGTALLVPAQRILNEISGAVLNAVGFRPDADKRHFTLSMSMSTAMVVAPILLDLTSGEARQVTFEIVEHAGPEVDPFEQVTVDVAIVADIVALPHRRRNLYVDRWVAVVWEGNTTVADALTVEDLSRLHHVAYRSPVIRTQPYVAMAAAGLEPQVDLVSTDFLLIPLQVVGTQRIAVVQERLVRILAKPLKLRVLDLPLEVPPLGIDIVANPRLDSDPATNWLIETLIERLR